MLAIVGEYCPSVEQWFLDDQCIWWIWYTPINKQKSHRVLNQVVRRLTKIAPQREQNPEKCLRKTLTAVHPMCAVAPSRWNPTFPTSISSMNVLILVTIDSRPSTRARVAKLKWTWNDLFPNALLTTTALSMKISKTLFPIAPHAQRHKSTVLHKNMLSAATRWSPALSWKLTYFLLWDKLKI